MSLTNPPGEISLIDSMLQSTATWATLTGATTWYPSLPVGGSVGAISPPYFILEPLERSPKAIAPGFFLPNGKLNIVLFLKTTSAAAIEDVARKIAFDLEQLQTGLPITGTIVGMAAESDSTFDANQNFHDAQADGMISSTRNITITVNFGVTT